MHLFVVPKWSLILGSTLLPKMFCWTWTLFRKFQLANTSMQLRQSGRKPIGSIEFNPKWTQDRRFQNGQWTQYRLDRIHLLLLRLTVCYFLIQADRFFFSSEKIRDFIQTQANSHALLPTVDGKPPSSSLMAAFSWATCCQISFYKTIAYSRSTIP